MDYKHDLLNDKWIIEDVYRGKRGGFFVEAGATNGVNGSGTVVLERDYGWDGICVEAIDHQFKRILETRKCRADNRALFSETGRTINFTFLPDRSGRSGISDFLRQSSKDLGREPGAAVEVAKETVSLFDLLKEHNAPEIVHYFCLDIEGAELDVLRAFPFDTPYTILAFSIEGSKCNNLMLANGYREVRNRFTDRTFEKYFLHRDIERYI
jgi:FkbM family methyltransferase